MTAPAPRAWHALPAADVIGALGTDATRGLTDDEAARRAAAVGPNLLDATEHVRWPAVLARQFKDALVVILVVAAAISFALGEAVDAATILAIVVLNAALGFAQEMRAERALEALQRMLAPRCTVVRDGHARPLDATLLVPGDVVRLATGDRVPADLRLVEITHLEVDESALTGESFAVAKHAASVPEDTPLAERTPLAFLGTAVTRGSAVGVVIGTGMDTAFGRVAALTASVTREPTPLQRRLGVLGRQLGALAIGVAVLVGVVGWLGGRPPLEMFLTAVALAVAVVPEGLPAVVTITLVLGIRAMLERNALLRRLQAAETLGSATVICSDKTGTLTRNEMTVREVWLPAGAVGVTGTGTSPEGGFEVDGAPVDPASRTDLLRLLRAGALCNHAHVAEEDGAPIGVGEPTEVALVVAAGKAGFARDDVAPWREAPFDADRKRMSVVLPGPDGPVLVTKGAPEAILARSTHVLDGDRLVPLDDARREATETALADLASRGLRTLALAERALDDVPDDAAEAEQHLVLLGLVGMLDPPRPEVAAALATARAAGVRTIMITGDAPGTALAIAGRIGLPADAAVTGPELDRCDDAALARLVATPHVFARTTPAHKLRLVHALQGQGHVVAMTGDGVNDAPALKAADIGVAMGRRGTEVARGAADMILLDDHYASIVGAIEEGRRQYANIQKFVRYLLTSNTGEVVAIAIGLALGGPLLLLPVQILWMNLVTDSVTAIALGLEPVEAGTMAQPPRPAKAPILDRRAAAWIGGLGAWLGIATVGLFLLGDTLDHARTLAFTGIVVLEKVNVFNFRSMSQPWRVLGLFTNPWLLAAWVLTLGLQVAAVYAPPLQAMLRTVPLSLADWGLIAAVAVPTFVLPEAAKWIAWRRRGGHVATTPPDRSTTLP